MLDNKETAVFYYIVKHTFYIVCMYIISTVYARQYINCTGQRLLLYPLLLHTGGGCGHSLVYRQRDQSSYSSSLMAFSKQQCITTYFIEVEKVFQKVLGHKIDKDLLESKDGGYFCCEDTRSRVTLSCVVSC